MPRWRRPAAGFRTRRGSVPRPSATIRVPAQAGARPFPQHRGEVANSKQQRKRVRVAARQRLENLRYRTQIKTLMRRLREAIERGDGEEIEAAQRRLTAVADRAAAHHAIHRNQAARRKSQAAKLASRAKTPA